MTSISLFNKSERSDVVLIITDSTSSATIVAHSQILAHRSEFFAGLLRFNANTSTDNSNNQRVKLKEYKLSIDEYGTVEECLDLIENSIYGCRPISFEQIQHQTALLNFLAIDGNRYNKKLLTNIRFYVQEASLSTGTLVLRNSNSIAGSIKFHSNSRSNARYMTIDKYLCLSDEFLEYLVAMIPTAVTDDNLSEIRKSGLIIFDVAGRDTNIANFIRGLYASDIPIIVDENAYNNILAKAIFSKYYDVPDDIYLMTKQLSNIKISTYVDENMLEIGWNIIHPHTEGKFLNIYIINSDNKFRLNCFSEHVSLGQYSSFDQLLEWFKIFISISDIQTDTNGWIVNGQTLAHLDIRQVQELEKLNGMIGYLYAAELLSTKNSGDSKLAEIMIREIAKRTGLQINNEYLR